MIIQMIKSLMHRNYKGYKIYLHNFSGFDCMYLIKHLAVLGKLNMTYRDGKFLKLGLKFMQ